MLFEKIKDELNEFFGREVSKKEFTVMRILNHAISVQHGILNEGTISDDEQNTIMMKWAKEGHLHFNINDIVIKKEFNTFIKRVCKEN